MSDGPLLVIEEGGEVHRLYLDSAVFGRSKTCDLSFDRAGVSRRHCEIVLRSDGALVRDLGSSHGTFLDGRRVQGESPVQCGQVVRLGPRGPRLRVMDARIGGAQIVDDEATRPVTPLDDVADEPTRAIGAVLQDVPPTETAERPAPVPPHVPQQELPEEAPDRTAGPGTAVALVPRRPAAAPLPDPAPAADADAAQGGSSRTPGVGRDLALGLVLGALAGAIVLVLIDVTPLRAALGL